jgi:hypothetical protein
MKSAKKLAGASRSQERAKPNKLPLPKRSDLEEESAVSSQNSEASGARQLSFPFGGQVTKPSFGPSLLTFARSDDLPLEGPKVTYLLGQFKDIRAALDLMEQRWKETLAKSPDAIPGWGLAPGLSVREFATDGMPGLKAWQAFEAFPNGPLELEDFLTCSRPSLTTLQAKIEALEGSQPEEARELVDLILGELLTLRQNAPSLKRLSRAEAWAQAARLKEEEEQE